MLTDILAGNAIAAQLEHSSHLCEEPARIPLFDLVGDMTAVRPDQIVPIQWQTRWLMADPVCLRLSAAILRQPQEGDLPLPEQLSAIMLDAALEAVGVDVEAFDAEYADEFDAEANAGPQPQPQPVPAVAVPRHQ